KPLTDLEKIQTAKKLLSEYYSFKTNKIKLLGKIGLDMADVALSILYLEPWMAVKVLWQLGKMEPKKACLELDPAGLVAMAERSENYGEYIWNAMGKHPIVVELGYIPAIADYILQYTNNNGKAEWIWTNLPGYKLVEADIIYYLKYHRHIPGFELPKEIKDAIENPVTL
ncbi:MAG: hypothetical protein AB1297_07145, partial [bacterium]